MKMNLKKTLCVAIGAMALAGAVVPAQAQWTEKYPVTPIPEQDVITAYLKANFGKIGEMAGQAIMNALKDPKMQAKMAQTAITYLEGLGKDNSRSQDDRARELIARIEAEIAILKSQGYVSAPTGPLNTTVAFSPSYNTAKLSWQADRPAPFTCQLFDGRNIQFIDVLQEADYRIYRNGKLIATLAGTNNGRGSDLLKVPTIKTNGFAITLSYSMPVKPEPGEVVFYDYDPYQGQVGTPVSYRVEAQRQGCGGFYNAVGTIYIGVNTFTTQVPFDADGNSIPDFIPESVVQAYRMGPPTPGNPPTQPPVGGLPGTGNYSLLGGQACACAGNPNIAKSGGWSAFVRAVNADLVAKTGVDSTGWPQIAAALSQCNSTEGTCTVGGVTIKRDFSVPISDGFRYVWLLTN
ncbi:hypothetical protein ACQ86G_04785 [Roseateles chitinivorans]|uniref:hypothetical protein n=1 Tax=Roseateles chitinivorans TaxID=2917965 RepID=UPI003D6760EF